MTTLTPGYHAAPKGHVATVVTHLELSEPPQRDPIATPVGVSLISLKDAPIAAYKDLFRAVGMPWLWFSRLLMDEGELAAILRDPGYDVFALQKDGANVGLLELDFREAGACELMFFGLVPGAIGGGLGRYLMDQAQARAFARPITRFHVHTCTLDSPQALAFYRRRGFVPIGQKVEIAADPRVSGQFPQDAAPHVPIIE